MEIEDIKTLIDLMNENALIELEVEEEGRKVRLVKEGLARREVVAVPAQMSAVVVEPAGTSPSPAAAADENVAEVVAPMVGTFYRAPSPDSDPFVDVGMQVTEEATVCIIEAMKVMNEIHAEMTGTVLEVLVEDGHPVEYGQPLFRIRLEE